MKNLKYSSYPFFGLFIYVLLSTAYSYGFLSTNKKEYY